MFQDEWQFARSLTPVRISVIRFPVIHSCFYVALGYSSIRSLICTTFALCIILCIFMVSALVCCGCTDDLWFLHEAFPIYNNFFRIDHVSVEAHDYMKGSIFFVAIRPSFLRYLLLTAFVSKLSDIWKQLNGQMKVASHASAAFSMHLSRSHCPSKLPQLV